MGNTEDYLDGLLDSITQAKSETNDLESVGSRSRSRRDERRSRVRPDDDFMEANGLNEYRSKRGRSRRTRRAHSEDDFLRSFEDDLTMSDADDLIRSFEMELRSSDDEDLSFEDSEEPEQNDSDDDFFASALAGDDSEKEQSPADAILSDIAGIVSEAKRVVTGEDDEEVNASDETDSIQEPDLGSQSMEEPDLTEELGLDFDMDDSLGAQEVPLMDESGEDLDLMDMLSGGEDGDLKDIEDLLASDEQNEELSDARESFEAAAEGVSDGGEGLEAGEAQEDGEGEGEEKPNIIKKILGTITGIFKKKDKDGDEEDSEDEEEDEDDDEEEEGGEEGGETKEEKKARLKKEKEEAKKKKKEEADAKKKAKEEEKKKKAEEKKKKQAAKAAKPKKKKKPKERSPKIPIPVIIVFLLFSFSIVASVQIMTNVLGYQTTIYRARKSYDKGDYSVAYRRLAGNTNLDGDAKKLRNRAKLMAYMETKQNEYLVCMASGTQTDSGLDKYSIRSSYQMALDSLISGVYFYQRNEEKANELGISEEYAKYGQSLEKELDEQFNLTVGDAVDLYHNSTRKEYTAALQKIIRQAGFSETY